MKNIRSLFQMALLTTLIVGCDSSDERLVRLADENSSRQADQNRDMAKLAHDATENHRRLVESTETSRQAVLGLEKDLQEQRTRLDDERRSMASERFRESLLGPIISSVALLLVCSLPLVLCWYLLNGLRSESDDETSELLLSGMIRDVQPSLPPAETRPAIEQQASSTVANEPEPPF